ncbi:MAG: hypothetical protein OEX00_01015 [Gammaproteobacteria bacterium]|nr:hypothetical protein [Gammaproteobacteria bacterium]MDH5694301.1 hypothetical protein [Gammaproteobacteria bacterium]
MLNAELNYRYFEAQGRQNQYGTYDFDGMPFTADIGLKNFSEQIYIGVGLSVLF